MTNLNRFFSIQLLNDENYLKIPHEVRRSDFDLYIIIVVVNNLVGEICILKKIIYIFCISSLLKNDS